MTTYYRINEVSNMTGWSESKIKKLTDLGKIPGTMKIINDKNERLFSRTSIDKIRSIEEEGNKIWRELCVLVDKKMKGEE
jgi:hypothetical protein